MATVVALDPITGQLKPGYSTDPTAPTMQRYTVPSVGSSRPTPLSVSPAGMVYHPNFGIMVYGPVLATTIQDAPPVIRNPFVLDPSHVNSKLQTSGVASGASNYGAFVPDMAGVAMGNTTQTVQWLLTPSCDWDARHTPGNVALASAIAKANLPGDPLASTLSMTVTDVMASTIVLTNGTMMVETFPELGTAPKASNSQHGFVSCGFSSSSTNTLLGIPGSQGTFGLFVNLYYYYDPSMFSSWPDACSSPPITSGWMMPRNVANTCPSPVSGTGLSTSQFTCPNTTQTATQAGPGPYPAFANFKDATSPCLCLLCANDAPTESSDTIVPCAHILNFSESGGLLSAQTASSTSLNQPYSFMATYPDDPVHVAYTPNEPMTDGTQSGCTPAFG